MRRLIADRELARPEQLTREAIERHAKRRALAGAGPARVASTIIAARLFARYLVAHGELPSNPATGIATPRAYRSAPKILTVPEVRRLLYAGKENTLPRDPEELVAAAMFVVQYGGALRPAELGPILVADVQWLDKTRCFAILMRRTKHSHADHLQRLGPEESRFLGSYLSMRPSLGKGPYLFPCQGARPMSADTVRRRFAWLFALRGLEPKGRAVVPKMLRTSRCTHFLAIGAPIHYVQSFMRHRSPETTIAHYAYLGEEHDDRLLARWDPMGRKQRAQLPLRGVMRDLAEGLSALGKPN